MQFSVSLVEYFIVVPKCVIWAISAHFSFLFTCPTHPLVTSKMGFVIRKSQLLQPSTAQYPYSTKPNCGLTHQSFTRELAPLERFVRCANGSRVTMMRHKLTRNLRNKTQSLHNNYYCSIGVLVWRRVGCVRFSVGLCDCYDTDTIGVSCRGRVCIVRSLNDFRPAETFHCFVGGFSTRCTWIGLVMRPDCPSSSRIFNGIRALADGFDYSTIEFNGQFV